MLEHSQIDISSLNTLGDTAEKLSMLGSLNTSGMPKYGWRLLANLKASIMTVSEVVAVGSHDCRMTWIRPIRVEFYGHGNVCNSCEKNMAYLVVKEHPRFGFGEVAGV